MKKFASLILALALCMGLAVPAFAADYGPFTISNEYDMGGETFSESVTFSAAKVEENVEVSYYIEAYEMFAKETYTKVTVQPGSAVTVRNSDGGSVMNPPSYSVREDGTYSYDYMRGAALSSTDSMTALDENNKDVVAFTFYGNGKNYLIVLGDDAAAPAPEPVAPAEPEAPAPDPVAPAEPPVAPAPVVPDAPGTYTVKQGDTWSSICINFYGDNAQRAALQKANKGVKLADGAVITLPEKLGKAVLLDAAAAAAGETLYTVKAGDTLGAIAKTAYGDLMQYKAIFERNADRLKNANTIYEGQVIVLPAK